jgi:hypothetical protein
VRRQHLPRHCLYLRHPAQALLFISYGDVLLMAMACVSDGNTHTLLLITTPLAGSAMAAL